MRRRLVVIGVMIVAVACATAHADDPVFSGPQPGEPLVPFTMKGVFDASAGKSIDLVTQAGGKPLLLVFVHEANRPSVAVTRALMTYAAKRSGDGLVGGVVWLSDDPTATEQFLKRARHALPENVPIGISIDGKEGPGAYGLNRNVTLTVLVAKANRVTASFPLIQPSLQADVPKILAEVVKLIGGTVPPVAELAPSGRMAAPATKGEDDPKLTELVRAVIRRDATPEDVEKAANAVADHIASRKPSRDQLGRIARRVVDSGKLENYGTARAQAFLREWAETYGPRTRKANEPTRDSGPAPK